MLLLSWVYFYTDNTVVYMPPCSTTKCRACCLLQYVLAVLYCDCSLTGEPWVPPKVPAAVDGKATYTKKDCMANNGLDYTGDLSVTMNGQKCLPWASRKALALSKGKDFIPEVKLVWNHCRNPDGDMEGPWCYVDQHGNTTVDYCDLEMCGELFH